MRAFAFLNVDIPWIAWLVYRGEMVSAQSTGTQALSVWHAKYFIDLAMSGQRTRNYRMELNIENIRRESYPRHVSRLSGLYFFEDIDAAKRAGRRWDGNFREEYITEIEIKGTPHISRFDSEWISHKLNSNDSTWILSYLSGVPMSDTPLWELLVEGRALVLGTRIRKLAYETVKRTWPSSLGLLELSRVAVELNSDLGNICPFLHIEDDNVMLEMRINFADAQNLDFLERLSSHSGPKNTNDLNAAVELKTPDLSKYFVKVKQ